MNSAGASALGLLLVQFSVNRDTMFMLIIFQVYLITTIIVEPACVLASTVHVSVRLVSALRLILH